MLCDPVAANDTKQHTTTNKDGDEIISFSYASYHDLDKREFIIKNTAEFFFW